MEKLSYARCEFKGKEEETQEAPESCPNPTMKRTNTLYSKYCQRHVAEILGHKKVTQYLKSATFLSSSKEFGLRKSILHRLFTHPAKLDFFFPEQWSSRFQFRGQDWYQYPYDVQDFLTFFAETSKVEDILFGERSQLEIPIATDFKVVLCKSHPFHYLDENKIFWATLLGYSLSSPYFQTARRAITDSDYQNLFDISNQWRFSLLSQLRYAINEGVFTAQELAKSIETWLPNWGQDFERTSISGVSSFFQFEFGERREEGKEKEEEMELTELETKANPVDFPQQYLAFGEIHARVKPPLSDFEVFIEHQGKGKENLDPASKIDYAPVRFVAWFFALVRAFPDVIFHLFLEAPYTKQNGTYACPLDVKTARGWCTGFEAEHKEQNALDFPALLETHLAVENCLVFSGDVNDCALFNVYAHYTDIRETTRDPRSILGFLNPLLTLLEEALRQNTQILNNNSKMRTLAREVLTKWPPTLRDGTNKAKIGGEFLAIVKEEICWQTPLISKAWQKVYVRRKQIEERVFITLPKTLEQFYKIILNAQMTRKRILSQTEVKKLCSWLKIANQPIVLTAKLKFKAKSTKTEQQLNTSVLQRLHEFFLRLTNIFMDMVLVLRILYIMSLENYSLCLSLTGSTHWRTYAKVLQKYVIKDKEDKEVTAFEAIQKSSSTSSQTVSWEKIKHFYHTTLK